MKAVLPGDLILLKTPCGLGTEDKTKAMALPRSFGRRQFGCPYLAPSAPTSPTMLLLVLHQCLQKSYLRREMVNGGIESDEADKSCITLYAPFRTTLWIHSPMAFR